jgi:hypothetical protein
MALSDCDSGVLLASGIAGEGLEAFGLDPLSAYPCAVLNGGIPRAFTARRATVRLDLDFGGQA